MFGSGGGERFNPKEFGKYTAIAKRDEKTITTDVIFNPRLDPAANIQISAPKFYSKHDSKECDAIDIDILNELKRQREIGPKEKYDEPVTENQRYGWYVEYCLERGRGDSRLHFARHLSELVKIKSLIDHADSITKSKR